MWLRSGKIMRRAAVVRQLLALDPLFHTERARTLWLDAARRNLQGELGQR
jgi:predicted metal-dependent HD superfamily phosphohydrolase